MARCHICDSHIQNLKFDNRTGKIEPCDSCLIEIYDSLSEFEYDDEEVDYVFETTVEEA